MQGRREMLEERRKRVRAIRTSCGDDLVLRAQRKNLIGMGNLKALRAISSPTRVGVAIGPVSA
jgi:hypothetical protein